MCFAFDLEDDAVRLILDQNSARNVSAELPAFNFLCGQLYEVDTSEIRKKGRLKEMSVF